MRTSMRTATRLRNLERVWTTVGCRVCRDRPSRVYLFEDDPEPQRDCPVCGRQAVILIRRYHLVSDVGD